MKYVVFVKAVPAEGGKMSLDPASEGALNAALGLKEKGDEIIVASMGPEPAEEVLAHCISLGADAAYLLTDEFFADADVHATARCLNAFIGKTVPDYTLIFCGDASSDSGTGMLPAELAEMLGRDEFYYTVNIEKDDCGFVMTQDYGDEVRRCRTCGGSVVSVVASKFKKGKKAKGKSDAEIKRLGRIDLGLGTFSVGARGSRISMKEAD
ncbi:MAG: electron transfer flavoprotein subunit beta/FixA family protein [Methanomethylophilus sp.]|jgi:electron transfer flavoprotein alpha/beta subunit